MTVLPQLKRDLLDAARATLPAESDPAARQTARSPAGRRRRVRRPSAAGLVPALSATVAIAVAVLALALLGRHHATPAPAAHGPSSSAQLDRNPEIGQLLGHFAILRRPQTAADRAWAGGQRSDPKGGGQVIPSLTRLATTIDGNRIFLTVDRDFGPARPGSRSPQDSYVLTVALVTRRGDVSEAPYDPNVGDYTIMPVPLLLDARLRMPSPPAPTFLLSMVPDGIATVRWVFRCSPARVAACGGRRTETVTPPLRGNIAVIARPALSPVPAVTWFNSAGRAVVVYGRPEPGMRPPKPFPGVRP